MNVQKITSGNTNPQNFQANKIAKTRNLLCATMAAASLLAASPKAEAQEVYTNAYGQQFVEYSDYLTLKKEYEEFLKEAPVVRKEMANGFNQEVNRHNVTAEQVYERIKEENKDTRNLICLAALAIGGIFGGKLITRIVSSVTKFMA